MRITARGVVEAEELLRDMADRAKDLSRVMRVAAEDTKTLIDDSFDRSTSPDGTPWQGLSEATIAISPRREGGKPLVDTARLRNSIYARASRRSMSFGTNVAYGAPHQFGAGIRVFGRTRATLPARPFLPVVRQGSRFGLMNTGAAGAHWSGVRSMVATYIRTGRIE